MNTDLDGATLTAVCAYLDLDAFEIRRALEVGTRGSASGRYCEWTVRDCYGGRRTCSRTGTESAGFMHLCPQHRAVFVSAARAYVRDALPLEMQGFCDAIAYRAAEDPEVADIIARAFGAPSAESIKSRLTDVWSAA